MGPIPAAPNFRDMPPVPQNRLPLYVAPLFALLGMLGLALVIYELPSILLLFAGEEGSTLALLRAYWTGYAVYSGLAGESADCFWSGHRPEGDGSPLPGGAGVRTGPGGPGPGQLGQRPVV